MRLRGFILKQCQVLSDTKFGLTFYIGLALGSLSGGVLAYLTSPTKATRIFSKVIVLVSLLAGLANNQPVIEKRIHNFRKRTTHTLFIFF